MKEHPILFSGEMVRAILNGRKTQTRRVLKKQPQGNWGGKSERIALARSLAKYRPGDILWIKETWQYADWTGDGQPWIRYKADGAERLIEDIPEEWGERLNYIWAELSMPENCDIDGKAADRRYRSPMFMPKWAARLFREVTDVKVERLQEITEEDAIKEGIAPFDEAPMTPEPIAAFAILWNSINAKRGYPWESNPWVAAYTFREEYINGTERVTPSSAPR